MTDGAPAEPMRPRFVAGDHSSMRSLILLMKFEFLLQFWTQPAVASALPTGRNRGADRLGRDRGLTPEGAVGWVAGIRAFTPVFAGYAKSIIFRFERMSTNRAVSFSRII
jgi:hypothetical protein